MKTTDILEALSARLSAYATAASLPVAWPGVPKDPPSTGMWLEARFFPNEPSDLTWDKTPHQDIRGFFQVAVYWRPGTATGQNSLMDASTVADDIIAYFPKGEPISDVMVRKSPWQSPAIDLEGKSFIPVTILYRGIVGAVVEVITIQVINDQGNSVVDDQSQLVILG